MAAILGIGQAISADLPPPPEPEPEEESCLYARIDGGYAFHDKPNISKTVGYAPWGGNTNATDEELEDTFFIEGGLGCKVWSNFRIDGIVGYRGESDMSEFFGGLDGNVSTFYGFLNAYYDIFTWGRLTPYVGAGIGFAHHSINDITLPATVDEGSHTSFAWNAQAGVAVAVTHNLSLDFGYRYTDWVMRNPAPIRISSMSTASIRTTSRSACAGASRTGRLFRV